MDSTEQSKHYYELLQTAAKNKPQRELKSSKWVTMMIDRLQRAKDVRTENLHRLVKESVDNYDIILSQRQEKRLVIKAKENEPQKFIIPLEESYNIVMKAHTHTMHGDVKAMADWLFQLKIEVADICLPVAVDTCEKCQSLKSEQNVKKSVWLVTIMDMGSQDLIDGNIDCLLVYQQVSTRFLMLRPFSSADIIESLTSELFHIFSQVGPPQCLLVQPALKDIMTCVLNERLNIFFKSKVALEVYETNDAELTEDIKTNLLEWLAEDSERTWSVGCYIIQYKLNSKPDEDGQTPLQRLRQSSTDIDNNKNIPAPANATNTHQRKEITVESVSADLHGITLETDSTDPQKGLSLEDTDEVKIEPEELDIETFIANNPVLVMPVKDEY